MSTAIKPAELRQKTLEQLRQLLDEHTAQLRQHHRMHAGGELPNPRVIGATRRTIARLHTLIAEQAHNKKEES